MKQKVLIELDALLDTRLGVLGSINPEAVKQILERGYHDRPSDEMGLLQDLVTTEAYQEAYRKREADILPLSRVTVMHFLLSDVIQRLEKIHIHAQVNAESVEVFLNIYPYVLSEDEQEDLCTAVMARVGLFTPCRCIRVAPEALTISYINQEEYTGLIVYNFQEWVNGALKDLEKRPDNAPGVTMLVPGLLQTVKDVPSPEEIVDEKGNPIDPFQLVYSLLAEVIGIDFMPVEFFSIVPPEGKQQNDPISPKPQQPFAGS